MADVDLENGILRLVNTKGYKHRLVPMSVGMTNILTRYCLAMGIYGNSDSWLFPSSGYVDVIKAVKKGSALTTGKKVADEAIRRIAAIYHTDNMYKDTSPKEILDNRQQSVKLLVDAYFAWVKSVITNPGLDKSSALKTALNYSLNQEPYLRAFLEDPQIPLDNNDAERSIKKFCVGKHGWHIIDSKNGANASAMMYSIAETAKANGLNPFEYFQYVMDQLKEYPRNNVPEDKLAELMDYYMQKINLCNMF